MMSLYDIVKASYTQICDDYLSRVWAKRKSFHKVAGVLPLTFNSTTGKLANWEVYGNTQGIGRAMKNIVNVTSGYSLNHCVVNNCDLKTSHIRLTSSGDNPYPSIDWLFENPKRSSINFEYGKTYEVSFTVNETTVTEGKVGFRRIDNNSFVVPGTGVFNITEPGEKSFTFTYDRSLYPQGVYLSIVLGTTAGNQMVDISNFMVRESTTSPDFEPFGYQLPLIITNGESNQQVDIYLGDSLLMEGQKVSKASTGIDISVFEGENIIDTTLQNKPVMMFKRDRIGDIENAILGGLKRPALLRTVKIKETAQENVREETQ